MKEYSVSGLVVLNRYFHFLARIKCLCDEGEVLTFTSTFTVHTVEQRYSNRFDKRPDFFSTPWGLVTHSLNPSINQSIVLLTHEKGLKRIKTFVISKVTPREAQELFIEGPDTKGTSTREDAHTRKGGRVHKAVHIR